MAGRLVISNDNKAMHLMKNLHMDSAGIELEIISLITEVLVRDSNLSYISKK